jgi:hypothetical protein
MNFDGIGHLCILLGCFGNFVEKSLKNEKNSFENLVNLYLLITLIQ